MTVARHILLAFLLLAALPLPAQESPDPVLRELLRQAANDADSFPDRFDAQVWLTDMSRRLRPQVVDHAERIAILKRAHFEARRADLPPELVLAVIDVESNFDRFAISVAGAQGLMQVMPFWQKALKRKYDVEVDLFDLEDNVMAGALVLSRGGKTPQRMLSYYNTGQRVNSTPYQRKVMRYWRSIDAQIPDTVELTASVRSVSAESWK